MVRARCSFSAFLFRCTRLLVVQLVFASCVNLARTETSDFCIFDSLGRHSGIFSRTISTNVRRLWQFFAILHRLWTGGAQFEIPLKSNRVDRLVQRKTVNRVKSLTTLFDRSSIDAMNEQLHVRSSLECDERGPTVGDKGGFDERPLDFRGENRAIFKQGTPVTRYRGGDGFHWARLS